MGQWPWGLCKGAISLAGVAVGRCCRPIVNFPLLEIWDFKQNLREARCLVSHLPGSCSKSPVPPANSSKTLASWRNHGDKGKNDKVLHFSQKLFADSWFSTGKSVILNRTIERREILFLSLLMILCKSLVYSYHWWFVHSHQLISEEQISSLIASYY